MKINELMEMAAEKTIAEVSWDTIEFLFKPTTGMELLARLDLEGTQIKFHEWWSDDSPDAMPHRFRSPYINAFSRVIEVEKFYRKLKKLHEKKECAI